MKPQAPHDPEARTSAYLVMAMVAIVALPATLTLLQVTHPAKLEPTSPNPTPYGYTWSLLLFLVPILALSWWFSRNLKYPLPKKAFWWTIGLLTPLGVGLDFVLGSFILTFNNPGATLGWDIPAVRGSIPIEEYVFYFTGFLTVLLLYVWCDEYWLSAYNVPDYAEKAKQYPRLVSFHKESLLFGAVLLAGAMIYKKVFSADPEGFPLYFLFLLIASIIPSIGLFRTTRPFINWRAFSFTMFFILLVSLLWEATLGVPYSWWGYQEWVMMGVFVGAWSKLPVEAVCVWIAVTYTTVITFELIKIWQATGKPLRTALFGGNSTGE